MDKRICGQAEKGKHQWSKNRLWREMEVGTEQWEVEHIFRASNVRTPKKSFDLDRLIPVGPNKEGCLGRGDSAWVKGDP